MSRRIVTKEAMVNEEATDNKMAYLENEIKRLAREAQHLRNMNRSLLSGGAEDQVIVYYNIEMEI